MYYYRIHVWTDSCQCILFKSYKAIRRPIDYSKDCYYVERISFFKYCWHKMKNIFLKKEDNAAGGERK